MKSAHEKVFFHLEQDQEGYPPERVESLWANRLPDGLYEIDNIPFFVRGVSRGDRVSVEKRGEENHFEKLVKAGGHSTMRVIVYDKAHVDDLCKKLESMGCLWEQSHIPTLIAIDLPPNVDVSTVTEYLQHGEDREQWSYEEACLADGDG